MAYHDSDNILIALPDLLKCCEPLRVIVANIRSGLEDTCGGVRYVADYFDEPKDKNLVGNIGLYCLNHSKDGRIRVSDLALIDVYQYNPQDLHIKITNLRPHNEELTDLCEHLESLDLTAGIPIPIVAGR
ncbi:hypothetical protein GOV12_03395 [Candidatus Pacearchaeota archaeon]|nr:hypothetical protein [Candidatus Pacearchaeota archaeon]